MNAIIGLLDIMRRKLEGIIKNCVHTSDGLKEDLIEVKTNADYIETSSHHLLGLLNDILDIAKIEAGKIELAEEKTELSKIINAVAEIIRPRCEDKKIKFSVIADPFENKTFFIDSLRLRQVLINLLGNAVKFTGELGTIDFKAQKKDELDGKTLVEFSVRDTGIGIPDDKLSDIFESFEQGEATTSNNYGGTGLGLAISRSIVRLMGGEIELKSKLGEGSEFKFEVWFTESETETSESETPDIEGKFIGKKVLLVDDVEINRMICSAMLEIAGMEITEARDGADALTKFIESGEYEYDIILMDIRMPNMNGYECSEAIRSLGRADAKTVPIIALTANAFKEDIDKALEKGMNAHIAKPIEIDKLSEALFRFLNNSEV
jgi:CheY-like chemotaxis protein